jgi:hypothetical protein
MNKWSVSHSSGFTPEEALYGVHWIKRLVSPRDGLKAVAKTKISASTGIKLWPFSNYQVTLLT